MSDQDKQCWPAAKIQRQLRADEALIEMVRAQRVFLASRKQTVTKPAIPGQTKPWAWTEAEDERLKALVAQGASVVKAAAALKRKIVSVRTRARALGCPFPPLRVARRKWADASE
jgi:hypothetical protein